MPSICSDRQPSSAIGGNRLSETAGCSHRTRNEAPTVTPGKAHCLHREFERRAHHAAGLVRIQGHRFTQVVSLVPFTGVFTWPRGASAGVFRSTCGEGRRGETTPPWIGRGPAASSATTSLVTACSTCSHPTRCLGHGTFDLLRPAHRTRRARPRVREPRHLYRTRATASADLEKSAGGSAPATSRLLALGIRQGNGLPDPSGVRHLRNDL
jgi:hypothetical protein